MRERLSVLAELVRFVGQPRRWWLAPVLVGLVIVGTLTVIASASPLAPFIYPLF